MFYLIKYKTIAFIKLEQVKHMCISDKKRIFKNSLKAYIQPKKDSAIFS